MICPKCKNTNVTVQAVTEIKKKRHGWAYWVFFGWLFDMLLWIFLFLPRLIIQIFKREKTVSKIKSRAVCQTCGHSWDV
ncbi:hypothetical protein LJC42_01780 [Eubacteriales bacterium OttesenSCG-928-K08]|nr:hypothetical protein [Eubacteriales bacterium OttesenSCG-928-K08]